MPNNPEASGKPSNRCCLRDDEMRIRASADADEGSSAAEPFPSAERSDRLQIQPPYKVAYQSGDASRPRCVTIPRIRSLLQAGITSLSWTRFLKSSVATKPGA